MIGVGTPTKVSANQRLDIRNIEEYLIEKYLPGAEIRNIEASRINMRALVQKDYGKEKDCALTSITALIDYYTKHGYEVQEIYDKVEAIAKKYGYNGDTHGTPSLAIRKILDEAYKEFGFVQSAKEKCFKNLGYTYKFIKSRLDMSIPLILSLWNDGRDFYKDHSVTVVGYRTYRLTKGDKKVDCPTLMVYDNWVKTTSYIDFTQLGIISSIIY